MDMNTASLHAAVDLEIQQWYHAEYFFLFFVCE
uniref:BLTX774 n=1 Tax=Nephila pilipes TaxID=299642 RepID=A0A076L366_NEPPI|nr:BLTX774 [Nephila pilipes]